ncbi:MAG: PEP-CTERM sorting domain-containing protein [Verrucomicrobia bacterium]|nr:PEP-CTERM sorting domain-containing protein [Verrucomicrobiota bacterium]
MYQHQQTFAGRLSIIVVASSLLISSPASGQSIPVPNGSFENPKPPLGLPVSLQIDSWIRGPKPDFIVLPEGAFWEQTSGLFPNTPAGRFDHINNMDGAQAAYMFALPGVSLYQSLDAVFETGKSYNLSFGILGGGNITEGSLFEASLYYMSDAGAPVTLAANTLSFSQAGFPTITDLVTHSVVLGEVQASDAWAGKSIGVQLLSKFGTGSGYWDVDNVRLEAVPEPGTLAICGVGLLSIWMRRRSLKH